MSVHVLDQTVGVIGVIDMGLLSVIRRWRYQEQMCIREIERRTGLSRNTTCNYLRSNAVEVRFNVPDRPSRLDPFADKLGIGCGTIIQQSRAKQVIGQRLP